MKARNRISLELSARQCELLDELVATGLFGISRAEVIRTFIGRAIAEAIAARILVLKTKPVSEGKRTGNTSA